MFCVPNAPLISLKSHAGNEPSDKRHCDITMHQPMAVVLGPALSLLGLLPSIDKEKPHTETFSYRTPSPSRQPPEHGSLLNLLAAGCSSQSSCSWAGDVA